MEAVGTVAAAAHDAAGPEIVAAEYPSVYHNQLRADLALQTKFTFHSDRRPQPNTGPKSSLKNAHSVPRERPKAMAVARNNPASAADLGCFWAGAWFSI